MSPSSCRVGEVLGTVAALSQLREDANVPTEQRMWLRGAGLLGRVLEPINSAKSCN